MMESQINDTSAGIADYHSGNRAGRGAGGAGLQALSEIRVDERARSHGWF